MKKAVGIESRKHNWIVGVDPKVPGGSVLDTKTGKQVPRIYWCTGCKQLLDVAHSDRPGQNEEAAHLMKSACKGA